MNHLELFHLAEEPFANLPDTRFFFGGAGRAQALAQCQSALEGARRAVLVEAAESMGKTMLAHKLAESMAAGGHERAARVTVPFAQAGADKLLALALWDLTLGEARAAAEVSSEIFLQQIEALGQRGIRTVLVVDEAQMLRGSRALGEMLDLLSEERGGSLSLSMLFLALRGQGFGAALQEALSERGMSEAAVIGLEPFTPEETAAYVAWRLSAAGLAEGAPSPFSGEAMDAVSALSAGAPGRIGLLCEESLAEAARTKQKTVGARIVRQSAERLGLQNASASHPAWSPLPYPGAASPLPDSLDEIDTFLGSLQAG